MYDYNIFTLGFDVESLILSISERTQIKDRNMGVRQKNDNVKTIFGKLFSDIRTLWIE